MSKGSADRGSQAKRRQSKIWCERCGKMRGGSCECLVDEHSVEEWKRLAEREHGKLIMDTLMGAMGYTREDKLKEEARRKLAVLGVKDAKQEKKSGRDGTESA